ncbi:hypothetical protein TRICI_000676 [Trichomonascus ciferrii]|uniref:Tyrosine specific protein phosphatases domain-containing protein n=1 Tax=Trichomonascus ciferrii TaxID=44093 RepID=A0A642VBH2_9ASCO|nr:hypothetical protein TRICI_000676 [Trichomonascus ciferrii]
MGITEERITVPVGDGNVVGILTLPETVLTPQPGMRVVVICHGIGGHKDYCYQKLLAHELAKERSISTFRFDFRGCGDSSKVSNPALGRSIMDSDLADLDAVILDYLVKRRQFTLGGIVGHSRGSVAVFQWVFKRQDEVHVPCIVNCSGRYVSEGFVQRVEARHPNLRNDGGYTLKALRNGEYLDLWIPLKEAEECSRVDMSVIEKIRCPVLSIYGLDDKIVPLADADRFSQTLKGRHTLRLIANADHNFYQMGSDGRKIANHNVRVTEIVSDWFSAQSERERFLVDYGNVGVISRWKNVDGISNFRDFGGFATRDGDFVRPGLLYRSANTSKVSEQGKKDLQDLNVRVIFDLRSEQELKRVGSAKDIPGCEVRWIPIFKDQDLSPAKLAERNSHFFDPIEGFQNAYRELLDKAGHSYRNIMLHIRDRPNDGFVVHCTAGKDRTGMICALILLLMNVEPDTIAREYELTTYGLVEEIPKILRAVEKDMDMSENKAGMLNLLSSRYDSMITTISIIHNEYGGAENWFKTHCNLSDQDLRIIKKNLSAKGQKGWSWQV